MTALVAVFGPALWALPNDTHLALDDAGDAASRMLARMSARGAHARQHWRGDGALLAAARHPWERGPAFGGAENIAVADDVVVAADASVYYGDELWRTLAGVPGADLTSAAAAGSAAALVLAAYRAWGPGCAARLEGDLAFVLWDRRRRCVMLARDYAGSRPLHWARVGDAFVVASTVRGVLGYPGCHAELDVGRLAEETLDLPGGGERTAFAAVRAVPAGHRVEWDARAGAPRACRAWQPPPFDEHSRVPFADAAQALRHTLARAVGERSAGGGEPTTVWLSGGYDSTAVLAAACDHAERDHAGAGMRGVGPVRAVSISYPPGDSGREDETITAVAAHIGVPVHWLDVRRIPMLEGLAHRAAQWDEPLAHPFERWNEALAEGSCAAGGRVALNGHGGDQLFSASKAYLADLLAGGQLAMLASEWRARRLGRGNAAVAVWQWILRPRLPEWVARAAARTGRPLGHYLERPLPPWAGPRAGHAHEAAAAGAQERRRARGQTAAAFEAEWYLTNPYIASMAEAVASRALATGVSLRFPLYDARVIALAAGRPRAERAVMGESKRLLRRAVQGALPAEVLAPRPYRTGTTTTYWRSAVRTCGAALFDAAFADPLLAELGVVDPVRLRAEAARLVAGEDERHAAALLATLRAELWLRARSRAADAAEAD